MKTNNKSNALKGALLVALVASSSGSFFATDIGTEVIRISDFASEVVPVVPGTVVPGTAQPAPITVRPANPDAVAPGAGVRPDAAAAPSPTPAPVAPSIGVSSIDSATLRDTAVACNRNYTIVYTERVESDVLKTVAEIYSSENRFIARTNPLNGSAASNFTNPSQKTRIRTALEAEVRRRSNDCAETSDTAIAARPGSTEGSETQRPEETVTCQLDSEARSFTTYTNCLRTKLEKIKRDASTSKEDAANRVVEVANDIKDEIKAAIVEAKREMERQSRRSSRSRDDDSFDYESSLESLADLAKSAGDLVDRQRTRLSLSSREGSRIRDAADKIRAMGTGAELQLETARYARDANLLTSQYVSGHNSFQAARNPWEQQQAVGRMNSAVEQLRHLNVGFERDVTNGYFRDFNALRTDRVIDPIDFRDLASSYQVLRDNIDSVLNPGAARSTTSGGSTTGGGTRVGTDGRIEIPYTRPGDLSNRGTYTGRAVTGTTVNRPPAMDFGNYGSSASRLAPPSPLFSSIDGGRRF